MKKYNSYSVKEISDNENLIIRKRKGQYQNNNRNNKRFEGNIDQDD